MTLLGLPNAGKSSLLNRLVGEELAIVTPKPQTTWRTARGYVRRPDLELVVTDTPGIQEGTKALNAALAKNAALQLRLAREGTELVGLVIDASDVGRRLREHKPLGLEALAHVLERECGGLPLGLPAIPVLNKSDLVRKREHREAIEQAVAKFAATLFQRPAEPLWVSAHPSAKADGGIDTLIERLREILPQGKQGELFEEDALSDRTLRDFAADYIREQCFLQLGEEVPYSIAVELERFDESDPALVRIEAVLHVERESQKPLVIGKGAAKIKAIGTRARERIEKLIGTKVFLGLRVKVTPHWAREKKWVERFGYAEK